MRMQMLEGIGNCKSATRACGAVPVMCSLTSIKGHLFGESLVSETNGGLQMKMYIKIIYCWLLCCLSVY